MKKPPAVLGLELLPLIEPIVKILDDEADTVRRQQAIEMLVVRHASLFGRNTRERVYIAESMHKHIMQIIAQWETFK